MVANEWLTEVTVSEAQLWHLLVRHMKGETPQGEEKTSLFDPCLECVEDVLVILCSTLLFGSCMNPYPNYVLFRHHFPHTIGYVKEDPEKLLRAVMAWVHLSSGNLLDTFHLMDYIQPCKLAWHHYYHGLSVRRCMHLHFPVSIGAAEKTNRKAGDCTKCGLPIIHTR